MFTTQRFQNYGILADAVGDYKAQKARYAADQSAENKAEVQRAGKNLNRAVTSQIVQTAVFAAMKIGADFLLHRWDREQDENGDVTAASVGKRFLTLYTESAAGNLLYGAENLQRYLERRKRRGLRRGERHQHQRGERSVCRLYQDRQAAADGHRRDERGRAGGAHRS